MEDEAGVSQSAVRPVSVFTSTFINENIINSLFIINLFVFIRPDLLLLDGEYPEWYQ